MQCLRVRAVQLSRLCVLSTHPDISMHITHDMHACSNTTAPATSRPAYRSSQLVQSCIPPGLKLRRSTQQATFSLPPRTPHKVHLSTMKQQHSLCLGLAAAKGEDQASGSLPGLNQKLSYLKHSDVKHAVTAAEASR